MGLGGFGKDLFVRLYIFIPFTASDEVGAIELPVFFGCIKALLEALLLGVLIDMEEHLNDDGAFVVEQLFEVVDMTVAFLPDGLGAQFIDADCKNILVVAAIENNDFAITGGLLVYAPEVVVPELAGVRLLEAGHMDALRVDSAESIFDGAVFSAGIHALKNQEEFLTAVDKETLLQIGQFDVQLVQLFERLFLRLGQIIPWIGRDLCKDIVLPGFDQIVVEIA